jgi:hypothetical protein
MARSKAKTPGNDLASITTMAEWTKAAKLAAADLRGSTWRIADLLLIINQGKVADGTGKTTHSHKDACAVLGIAHTTGTEYVKAAKLFPPDNRPEGLTVGHVKVLKGIAEADVMQAYAERIGPEGLSVAALREEIFGKRTPAPRTPNPKTAVTEDERPDARNNLTNNHPVITDGKGTRLTTPPAAALDLVLHLNAECKHYIEQVAIAEEMAIDKLVMTALTEYVKARRSERDIQTVAENAKRNSDYEKEARELRKYKNARSREGEPTDAELQAIDAEANLPYIPFNTPVNAMPA